MAEANRPPAPPALAKAAPIIIAIAIRTLGCHRGNAGKLNIGDRRIIADITDGHVTLLGEFKYFLLPALITNPSPGSEWLPAARFCKLM
jgi:hypothetical protein